MRNLHFILLFLSSVLGVSLSYAHPLEADLVAQLQARVLQSYSEVSKVKVTSEDFVTEKCFKETVRLTIDDDFDKEEVEYKIDFYYPYDDSTGEPRKPIGNLIVLPTIVGVSPLEQSFARNSCRQGFKVAILGSWTGNDIKQVELETHDRQAVRALVGIKKILDLFQEPAQIVGTSLGSLYSSAALALEPRITGGILVVAGADIPSIMVYSEERRMRALREKRQEQLQFKTNEDYLSLLKDKVHFTPEIFINDEARKKPLMMIIALDDTKVPTKYQQQLVDDWKPKELIQKSHGHVRSILDVFFFDQDRMIKFLKQNLKTKAEPVQMALPASAEI